MNPTVWRCSNLQYATAPLLHSFILMLDLAGKTDLPNASRDHQNRRGPQRHQSHHRLDEEK